MYKNSEVNTIIKCYLRFNIIKSLIYPYYTLVYDLADMKLKTATKRFEDGDKHLRRYNKINFSVTKLQLCFTRGANSVK